MCRHGAFADASGFGGVIRELTTSGYEVVAPPNPLRSLAFDANAVAAAVRAIAGPVVLVGHSYGGGKTLGVSVNTVGTQLRSIFTKLGIQSRVQLANSLRASSGSDPA